MARVTPDVPQRGAAQNLLNVVDNYYAPARDRVGEQGMSQGLEAASNFFGQQAAIEKEHQLKEISLQAQQDAMQGLDPDEELAQVRKGLLFRSNSRAYNQVYNETMGKKAAIEFKENATLDYEKSGLSKSTDPAAFREWMNNRTNEFLTAESSQNPYFLAGAMPYVEQTAFNMGAKHMSNINSTLKANHAAAVQRQAEDIALAYGNGDMSSTEFMAALVGVSDEAWTAGLEGATIKKSIFQATLAMADATDNTDLLHVIQDGVESGELRLSPNQLNAVQDQIQGIHRDIDYRRSRLDKQVDREQKQFVARSTDIVADILMEKPDATLDNILNAPYNDAGDTLGQEISNAPNTKAAMESIKSTFETITSTFSISEGQEKLNNLAISDAFRNGNIKDATGLMSWMSEAKTEGGYRFNEANTIHAFTELEKYNDPESVYKTQTYKDYYQNTKRRLAGFMTPDSDLMFNFDGSYQGKMADDVSIRFQTAVDERLVGVNIADPDAIKTAIKNAELDVLQYYQEYAPDLFNKQNKAFNNAAKPDGDSLTTALITSPLYQAQQEKLIDEQRARVEEQTQGLTDIIPEDRPDLSSGLPLTVEQQSAMTPEEISAYNTLSNNYCYD